MTEIPTLTLSSSLRISMKDRVTKTEVSDFKNKWCNENQLISSIISNELQGFFIEPVLDVGAGLGDIAYNSLYEKKVICIDVNKISDEDYPLSVNHERHQIDFFDYEPNEKINTVFISHTLQFLDEDIGMLNRKIRQINPEVIIVVMNKNDDIIGDIIEWSEFNYLNPNPEVPVEGFPEGYELAKTLDFKADIECDSFHSLATQISYLMLIDLDDLVLQDLISFLRDKLYEPVFQFNQTIEIYLKDGKR